MRTARLVFVLAILPVLVFAQDAYDTPSDTLFYMLVNPYRMYWIRNGDTLSQPVHAVSVEAQRWARAGREQRVVVRGLQLDVNRKLRTDTFTLAPLGSVRAINGHPPGMNERVDLVPRLPGGQLAVGMLWADTLHASRPGGPIPKAYSVTRRWRVERLFDSAGTRWARLSASGVIHYQDGWWMDSTAGRFASLDVTGPLTERALLSVTQRRLIERFWTTNLSGTGTLPSDHGVDTTAAGLISSDTQRVISRDRAHFLAREFAGAETTYSYDPGPILLHVVDRQHSTIATAMARNDGLVGTAHASFTSGSPTSYDAVWTDTAVSPHRTAIAVVGDSLKIQRSGGADTTSAVPAEWWGIADYAMNELLVPVFLAHPLDKETEFAIYRPYAGHWDTGTAVVRRYGENFVALYHVGGDTLQTVLLFTPDGELLMGENSGPTGAERLPPPGSARRARLDAILKGTQKKP